MFSELSDCVCEVHLEIYEGTMFCPTKWDCFSSSDCLKLCEARVPVKPVSTEVLMMYTYEVSCLLSMKYHVPHECMKEPKLALGSSLSLKLGSRP